jgi:hypothetical protein
MKDKLVYNYSGSHTPVAADRYSVIEICDLTDLLNTFTTAGVNDAAVCTSLSVDGTITTNQHYWPFSAMLFIIALDGTLTDQSGASNLSQKAIMDLFASNEFSYKQLGRIENATLGSQDSGGSEFVQINFHRTYNVPKRLRKKDAASIFKSSDYQVDEGVKASLAYMLWYGFRDAATIIRYQFMVTMRVNKSELSFGSMEGL